MYELEYVKRRKRKKIVAITGSISVIVVSVLSIVAFLGRFVGTFTVSLDAGNIAIALCKKSDFVNSTSYLRIDKIPAFKEFTYGDFINDKAFDIVDSEETDMDCGASSYGKDGSIETLNFFKYTFFLKNTGDKPAAYNFALNIVENKPAEDGRRLDDTLRVIIFANDVVSEHNKKIFAKRSTRPTHYVDGEANYDSPISVSEYDSTAERPFMGYAEQFKSDLVIASMDEPFFPVGTIRRYTIVTWLEGFASDNQKQAPKGASMKLGVEINAYEIK